MLTIRGTRGIQQQGTALPCLVTCDLHMTAIPERDLRVPKPPTRSALQNTSRTPGKVYGSSTLDPTGRRAREPAVNDESWRSRDM